MHPCELLDVFPDEPLARNQLAVFTAGEAIEESLWQRIARETNLAEKVFLLSPQSGGDAAMRIFTTVEEVPFAGDPVFGTACLLAPSRSPG